MRQKQNGYIGNTNASKPPAERLDAVLSIRCKKEDLLAWEAAAKDADVKKAVWIANALNSAIGR